MASSSGSTLHDVYVSHRVEDTGNTFTSHLKSALDKSGIKTLIDDRSDEGEEISERFLDMIPESQISVVFLSKNYAGSQKCLDELVKIIAWNNKNKRTHHVLPVFIGVEPTHVRRQIEAFGAAFETLINKNQQLKEKEKTWRGALVEIAAHSGWDSNNTKSEVEIVNGIVERTKEIINKQPSSNSDDDDDFVGISRVEKVKSLLRLELMEDVQSVGIWGIGGIGKTTIAERIFYEISNQFDRAIFLRDVREKLERHGLDYLSKDILSQLIDSHNLQVPMNFSSPVVQRALKRNKFLIIFDDVTSSLQLKSLVKPHNFYGPGSRIIFTSRNKQVLKNYKCKEEHIYKVEELNHHEAFQLFAFHAFQQQPCTERHKELSEKALSYAQGLPLALIVLGRNLYDKNIKEWESELEKLKDHPDGEIKKILMISYEGLEETEKCIFLDIACVFLGWERNQVETILNACGFYATSGLSRLQDKALITISRGTLETHNLLQQMGQDIILHEPSGCSRIWRWEDFYDVMTRSTGTEKVEVISVDLYKAPDMDVMPEAFEKMLRLRVLDLHSPLGGIKVHLPKGLRFLSDKLTYLKWRSYPLASLPDKFLPNNLIELHMEESLIVQLWCGGVEPHVPNLKVMNLMGSVFFISLPDFSKYPNLENLNLMDCSSLIEIPSSIRHLSKLRYLDLEGCSKLTKLSVLPTNVVELYLSGTAIVQLPSSIGELKCLERLIVCRCNSLTSLPESLGNIKSLWLLDIERSGITSLPSSLCHLSKLKWLNLSGSNVESLPDLPSSLEILHANGCRLLRCLSSLFGGDAQQLGGFKFSFAHCINLDGDSIIRSLADARPRMEAIAAEWAKSKYPYTIEEDKKCSLYIPGSKVPEWFQYRAEGSLVKLKLFGPKLEDLSRLAFCCVVAPGYGPSDFSILSWKCLLVTDKFGTLQVQPDWYGPGPIYSQGIDDIQSEHVFIWYADIPQYLRNDIRLLHGPLICSEATFEFQAQFYDCKIRRCGVTPIGRNCETSWAPLVEDGSQGEEWGRGGPQSLKIEE